MSVPVPFIRCFDRITGAIIDPVPLTVDPTGIPPSPDSIFIIYPSDNVPPDDHGFSCFYLQNNYNTNVSLEFTLNVNMGRGHEVTIAVFTRGVTTDFTYTAGKTFIANNVVIHPLPNDLILYLFRILKSFRGTNNMSRFPWYEDFVFSIL